MADVSLPIYVDLDETLVKTDVAQELLCQTASKPANWSALLQAGKKGRAAVKSYVSQEAEFNPANLPYRHEVLDYLKAEKARGRQIILASATDIKVAQKAADFLGIFDDVIASNQGHNAKGAAKLTAIQEKSERFEYIGDSKTDIPIWQAAEVVGAVNAPIAARSVVKDKSVSLDIQDKLGTYHCLCKAMRPHQWAKNALIFLPLFFSHQYGQIDLVMQALLAAIIFSFCASAIYILNDILDIEADRRHPRKRLRPFAAGELQPVTGAAFALALLAASLATSAVAFGPLLTGLFGVYVISTTLYSAWLKHKPVVDVITLTCLYTLRVFVGGVAIGVAVSPWLLNFSLFFFASLAFMKRYTEMLHVQADGKQAARGYLVSDLSAILPMGIACGGLAVLTLTLYLDSDYVAQTYGAVQILWLIAPIILFWIFRAWLKALRDEIDDDPVIFALRDPISRLTLGLTIVVILASKFMSLEGILP